MAASSRSQVTVMEDTSMERLYASQLSKLLVLAPPWLLLASASAMAGLFHALFPAPLAAAGVGVMGSALAALTWHVTRQRGTLGRWHAAGSMLAAAGWTAAATADGVLAPGLAYLLVVGGPALALSWNIRAVIRQQHAGGGRPPGAARSPGPPWRPGSASRG